jgi:DNA-binding NarL/FixJ family response regulator
MRIVLVGRPAHRARLRSELEEAGLEIAGEFDTLNDAQISRIRADATVLARRGDRQTDHEGEPDAAEWAEWIEEPLTRREIDVLQLLAEGLPNKSIAARLGVSDQTVKFHVASILAKLAATNRTDAVRRALHRGLINL